MPNRTAKSVAIIAGDGIGPEVVDSAVSILQHLQSTGEIDVTTTEYDWGSGYFKATGRMMPEDGIATLARHDAILLGAVGDPEHPRHRDAVGSAHPDPPGVPAVHQPAPGEEPGRGALARSPETRRSTS